MAFIRYMMGTALGEVAFRVKEGFHLHAICWAYKRKTIQDAEEWHRCELSDDDMSEIMRDSKRIRYLKKGYSRDGRSDGVMGMR